jgi:hypothetical protein
VTKQLYGSDTAPAVYVAVGSHASYFSPGAHGGTGPVGIDNADGASSAGPIRPTVLDIDSEPSWVRWPGRWGSSDPPTIGPVDVGSSSPRGPAFHGTQWSQPGQYASQAGACTVSQSAGAPTQSAEADVRAPAAPTIDAALVGGRVIVDYQLSNASGIPQAKYLLLTIQGTGAGDTPIGIVIKPDQETDSRTLPAPRGQTPYVVRASSLSADGARSRIATSRVEGSG